MAKMSTKGYTLLELMVVLAVMGILGTMLATMMNTGGWLLRNTNATIEAQTEVRLAMSYITMRIRQNDVSNGISVDLATYSHPVLTIKDSAPSNAGYSYWIYSDGVLDVDVPGKCGPGKLREQHGTIFDTTLENGEEIASIGDFTVGELGSAIKNINIEVKSVDGLVNLKQNLTLRSDY